MRSLATRARPTRAGCVLAIAAALVGAAGSPSTSPHDALRALEAAARDGDVARGAKALAALDAALARGPRLGKRERALVAATRADLALGLAVRANAPDKTIAAARAALAQGGDGARAHAALVDVYARTGRDDLARRALAALLADHTAAPEARAREARLVEEPELLGDAGWTRRLDGLVGHGRLARARDDARVLVGMGRARPATTTIAMAKALVRGGVPEEAIVLLEGALVPGLDAASREALLESRAWALGKSLRIDDAVAAYRALVKESLDAKRRGEACFFAGFLRYEIDDIRGARDQLKSCLDAGTVGGRAIDLWWYVAWTALLDGDTGEARRALDTLVARHPTAPEARKHRFFRAELLHGAEPATALAEWTALVDEDPLDWYGLLAQRRRGAPPITGVAVAADALAAKAPRDENAARARALFDAGYTQAVFAAVWDRPMNEEAAALAHAVDVHHIAWRHGARFLPFPRTTTTRDPHGGAHRALAPGAGWRASYATPWPALVDEGARAGGVPSSFVYAIMRTESGFDARARSFAGARGALQLMPHTARGIARVTGAPLPDDDALYRPEVNVALGARALGRWAAESGSLLLAAAAYNGAPENVEAWVARYGALDVVRFVERIPFRETRDYVKKVLATDAVYRALDGAPLALVLPDALPRQPLALTRFLVDLEEQ